VHPRIELMSVEVSSRGAPYFKATYGRLGLAVDMAHRLGGG
jgi:hypothetical protein